MKQAISETVDRWMEEETHTRERVVFAKENSLWYGEKPMDTKYWARGISTFSSVR